MTVNKQGNLFLIPVPISENDWSSIPLSVIEKMHNINYFIVERARTSRRFMRSSGFLGDISKINFFELDKRKPEKFPKGIFDPIFKGESMGLMSEAGMPGIADPGAKVVEKAHKLGIRVIPLTGPSSIFLSLAASGLNGQQFCFHGYLPVKKAELHQKLRTFENKILKEGETQIMIETPYRNESFFQAIVETLNQNIKLCVAIELNGENEFIKTLSIQEWKKTKLPEMHKKTAVFLVGK